MPKGLSLCRTASSSLQPLTAAGSGALRFSLRRLARGSGDASVAKAALGALQTLSSAPAPREAAGRVEPRVIAAEGGVCVVAFRLVPRPCAS